MNRPTIKPFISRLPDIPALRLEIWGLMKLALLPIDEKEDITSRIYKMSVSELNEAIIILEQCQGDPNRDFTNSNKTEIMRGVLNKLD